MITFNGSTGTGVLAKPLRQRTYIFPKIRDLMKTTGKIEFSEFENYHRGKKTGEDKRRASAFWGTVQNQRMTQSDRRTGPTNPVPAKAGDSMDRKDLKL